MRINQAQECAIGAYTLGGTSFDAPDLRLLRRQPAPCVGRTSNGFTPSLGEPLFGRFRGMEIAAARSACVVSAPWLFRLTYNHCARLAVVSESCLRIFRGWSAPSTREAEVAGHFKRHPMAVSSQPAPVKQRRSRLPSESWRTARRRAGAFPLRQIPGSDGQSRNVGPRAGCRRGLPEGS